MFPALVAGSAGVLRAQESFVVAVIESDGFTRFDLSGGSSFSLIPFQVDLVSITSFQLRITQFAASGAAVTVRVDFYTSTSVVSGFANITCILEFWCNMFIMLQ